jgi:hypothetical protein
MDTFVSSPLGTEFGRFVQAIVDTVLAEGGVFVFTTQLPASLGNSQPVHYRNIVGDFVIFAHIPAYLETLLAQHWFAPLKMQ